MDIDLLKNLKISGDDFDELPEADKTSEDFSNKEEKKEESEDAEKINIDEKMRSKRRKQKILSELESELYYLGMKEGKITECRDPEDLSADKNAECRGILRKIIKNGLIMEYIFTSRERGIKNFHLNNVKIDLEKIAEEKLIKLLIIVKFFNEKYKEKDKEKKLNEKNKLSALEMKKLEEEKKEESRRKLVLDKL